MRNAHIRHPKNMRVVLKGSDKLHVLSFRCEDFESSKVSLNKLIEFLKRSKLQQNDPHVDYFLERHFTE